MHFIRSVGYRAILCLLQVAKSYKDDKHFFLHISVCGKSYKPFLNATGHHACSPTPTKTSIDTLLPAAKTFGLKLAWLTSQNDFNLYLVLVGGGCIL